MKINPSNKTLQKKVVLFRVDSSKEIGYGHVMRCLALAKALAVSNNVKIIFVCRDFEGSIHHLIESCDFQVILLNQHMRSKSTINLSKGPYAYSYRLALPQEEDVKEFVDKTLVYKGFIELIITDHYAIGDVWHRLVAGYTKKILAIDDLGDRAHFSDYLIDQTFNCNKSKYLNLVPSHTQLLLGTEYCLLREEFNNSDEVKLLKVRKRSNLNTVLVMLGGTNPDNIVNKIIYLISQMTIVKKINIIVNEKVEYLSDIKALCFNHKNAVLHISPNNIAEIMQESDIAIGAAGSASWERCTQGLPSIVIVLSENQREISEVLENAGVVKVLELNQLHNKLKQTLLNWLNDKEEYYSSVKQCFNICDGLGISRVIKVLLK
ncbi:UDP-2,4-diacetamido-2,4,6-trideoxy-beta-L-altropyranose hydrolase [Colwellia sp. 4_MG-2023]|uniref:UDP-2,4-diacetamido-2,4, 6-trideoxy-beta-L-altropyranose hydrolase n=1 Tax=unclassified Colwellia TaxID=196834 RepID=UPI0026E40B2E|nr:MULTISPECIES: UDP-2,4-diacetamido-2,4,6-trideoxy-beta-L-altropyranose hydrolase [unclassified Colwellia]MDO6507251.1 UDP-2,4-diacetamido-2,4,6-trideoxy-beta-L-altropyranose hydrolase [Colwellia sp. 5_MG-2023]MDO6555405.1 UDP-2,4-diacetamido-2,4,6-trideoxy-beta-L-altropyranose hydrolase [Colwellia sp. 4_MG-2023]